jgi:hypothetical protein
LGHALHFVLGVTVLSAPAVRAARTKALANQPAIMLSRTLLPPQAQRQQEPGEPERREPQHEQ